MPINRNIVWLILGREGAREVLTFLNLITGRRAASADRALEVFHKSTGLNWTGWRIEVIRLDIKDTPISVRSVDRALSRLGVGKEDMIAQRTIFFTLLDAFLQTCQRRQSPSRDETNH